jgi:signal peptidase I
VPKVLDPIVRAGTMAARGGVIAARYLRLFVSCTPARVSGASMEPTLRDGDRIAVRPPFAHEPHVGQIVVAETDGREVIKRVASVDPEGFTLGGDNRSASTDPGRVPRDAIRAVMIARYWPLSR